MNIHRAPSVWILSGETATVDRLVRGMEEVGRRGEVCGCERDPKRLVKFGIATEAVQGRFMALLRSLKASPAERWAGASR